MADSVPLKRSGGAVVPGFRMTVREIARRAGVKPEVVRYYVRIGLLNPQRDSNNGYKLFSEQDLLAIRFIRRAKRLGYTLKEIKQILTESRSGRLPCARVREYLQRHIRENRAKLAELSALQIRMEQALLQWENLPGEMPAEDTICHLIESSAGFGEEGEDTTP